MTRNQKAAEDRSTTTTLRGILLPLPEELRASTLTHEERQKDGTGCVGAIVWPAAMHLCDVFEQRAAWLRAQQCRAIELGSGVGLSGLVAGKAYHLDVTLTDYHELVLQALRESVRANGLTKTCVVRHLDWEDCATLRSGPWGLAFGADLAVSTRAATSLARCVRQVLDWPASGGLCSGQSGTFIYAHTERRAIYRDNESGNVVVEPTDSGLDSLKKALSGIDCAILSERTSGDGEPTLVLAFGQMIGTLGRPKRATAGRPK